MGGRGGDIKWGQITQGILKVRKDKVLCDRQKRAFAAFFISCKPICKSLLKKIHWEAECSVDEERLKVSIRWLGLSSMHKMKRTKTIEMRY